jgi:glycine hydroxymethyltransferase
VFGDREALLRSLERQRRLLAASIVLTPVDSLPFMLADRHLTAFLHGLYVSDKVRDADQARAAPIQFAGRRRASQDLSQINTLFAEMLGAETGSLRLLSGLHAHCATFMSIASIGDTVLLLPEQAGGHFSTRAILSRLGLRIIDVPVDYGRLCVDREATMMVLEREKPDFIFIDRSEGLRYEDFSFVGDLRGPVKLFDASQYLAPILMGVYDNPLDWGFDLMLFTLHKSFPGPQKAGIVSRSQDVLWRRLHAGLGTFVSSAHIENSYLAALTLLRKSWLRRYVNRMLEMSVSLEQELTRRAVPVVSRGDQGDCRWPGTQHVWVRASNRDQAFDWYQRLERSRIFVNYRKLPYDLGYGLRLGTSFAAVSGFDVSDTGELADLISEAIKRGPTPSRRRQARRLSERAATRAILPAECWIPERRSPLQAISYEPSDEPSLFDQWEVGEDAALQPPLSVTDAAYRQTIVETLAPYRRFGRRLVSIGAGNGLTELALSQAGWDVLATDSAESAVRLCLAKGLNAQQIGLFSADALGTFDAIYCDGVLGLLWHPDDGVSAAFRALARLGTKTSVCLVSNDLADTDERPQFTVRALPGVYFYRPPERWFAQDAQATGLWTVEAKHMYRYKRMGSARRREILVLRLLMNERVEADDRL